MGRKSLVKNVKFGISGRLHDCKNNKRHKLPKGATMLIVKEGRDPKHYCTSCAALILDDAKNRLAELDAELSNE